MTNDGERSADRLDAAEHCGHSQLVHLAPRGLGSPFVESLSSYLIRLAQAHVVPTGALVRHLVAPQLDQAYLDATRSNTISGFLCERCQEIGRSLLRNRPPQTH